MIFLLIQLDMRPKDILNTKLFTKHIISILNLACIFLLVQLFLTIITKLNISVTSKARDDIKVLTNLDQHPYLDNTRNSGCYAPFFLAPADGFDEPFGLPVIAFGHNWVHRPYHPPLCPHGWIHPNQWDGGPR